MFFHVNNLLYWNMYLPVINCILNAMCMNHLKFTKDREFEWQIVLNLAVILACFASVFRILANRQSAQRSRVRKLQYISELERSVTTLQVIHQFNSLSKKNKKKGKENDCNWAKFSQKCICDLKFWMFGWLLLQMEVSALSPRVAFLDHQRSLLTVGNSHLKQRIAALAQDKIFKDGTKSPYPSFA